MTAAEQHLAALAAMYGPDAETMRRELPDIGDAVCAQLHELAARPTPERAELLLVAVEGIRRHLIRFRDRLTAEGEGHDQ